LFGLGTEYAAAYPVTPSACQNRPFAKCISDYMPNFSSFFKYTKTAIEDSEATASAYLEEIRDSA
jgi:hypothetical protein